MESLLKPEGKEVKLQSDVKVRTIMWNHYVVAAIFSPVFKRAK